MHRIRVASINVADRFSQCWCSTISGNPGGGQVRKAYHLLSCSSLSFGPGTRVLLQSKRNTLSWRSCAFVVSTLILRRSTLLNTLAHSGAGNVSYLSEHFLFFRYLIASFNRCLHSILLVRKATHSLELSSSSVLLYRIIASRSWSISQTCECDIPICKSCCVGRRA